MGSASIFDKEFLSVKVTTYPNPFTEFVVIKWNDTMNRTVSLLLSDCQGRIVKINKPHHCRRSKD